MSKRDYELIAETFKAFVGVLGDSPEVLVVQAVAVRMAAMLAADNPRFDRERFLAASGL